VAVPVGIGILWVCFAVVMYVNGSKALRIKPLKGLTSMVGTRGIVVNDIAPEGQVKIKGETWAAGSADGGVIYTGEEVIVETQNGLKLMVRRYNKNVEN
jgi:membrane protein implicated in regulation of membrane protease activity